MKADRILELWGEALKMVMFADVWRFLAEKLVQKRAPVKVRKEKR